jgi:Big-like domain-containing protein
MFAKRKKLVSALMALAIVPFAQSSHAVLERMGPVNASPSVGGFPAWFQDTTGVTMEFCDLTSQAELTGGWCTLIPPGLSYPETFPTSFFPEHFYWDTNTVVSDTTTGTRARLIMAIEAAFANNDPVPGDQMTFGRIRIFITNLPFTGDYTVYTPYGKSTFTGLQAGDRLFTTDDVGVSCIGTFSCTLNTDIGPYLLPSPTPGGPELPPIPDLVQGQDPAYDALLAAGGTTPYPNNGKKYLADPGRIGPVTGSPLAPFVGNDGVTYNHNIFRIEGPNGWSLSTTDFTVTGRLMTDALVGKVTIDRASYAQTVASTTGKKVDVFATATPTSQSRLPTKPRPPAVVPQLVFFDAPCSGVLNPATGAVQPPFGAPAGVTANTQMASAGSKYWGQSHPAALPTAVCVEDPTSINQAGAVVPTYYNKVVTDELSPSTGWQASYNASGTGSLTINAKSSDTLFPPVITAPGYGTLVNGALTIAPLAAPPANVTLVSSEGDVIDLKVQTNVGTAGGGTGASAIDDTFTIFEDCSAAPATSCAAPQRLTPLANDTFQGGAIPAGAIVTLTGLPRLGTATVNADGSITYTPNANANGADAFQYKVAINGVDSNIANAVINITPVNDIPVAVADSFGAVVGKSNRAAVTVNDTDPDGASDIVNAQIVTWPTQLGVRPTPVAGVVTYTPTSTGNFTFSYRAVDAAGALSANTVNVAVTVSSVEAIVPGKTIYKVGNVGGTTSARWTVDGTDSVIQGETLTIVYNNGTFTAAAGGGSCNGTATNPKCVIGTAVVDSIGNFLFDQVMVPGGPTDPTDLATWSSKPTQVNIFSSSPVLGGARTNAISLK